MRKGVDEAAGLAVDTTENSDISGVPAPVPEPAGEDAKNKEAGDPDSEFDGERNTIRTGNGEGRQTKHTAAELAERAQTSADNT